MTPAREAGGHRLRGFDLVAALLLLGALPSVELHAQAVPTTGEDAERREQLRARLETYRAANRVPGAVLAMVSADGRVVTVAAGMSDTARREPMRTDHRLLMGSYGKTYVAAVAMSLVRDGRLDLDARVSRYVGGSGWYDSLPNAADITVRQLMNHTSGLVRYELRPDFTRDLTADPDRVWDPRDQVRYLHGSEAPFAAGSGWDYSDTNYLVLALVLERIVSRPIDDIIASGFLRPLALRETMPSDARRLPGLSQGYAGPGNPFGGTDAMLRDGELAINPQFEGAGGGYAATAGDAARWGALYFSGRLLPAEVLREATRGVAAPMLGRGVRYGLGMMLADSTVAGRVRSHSGFMPGYLTEVRYYPDRDVTFALLLNTSALRLQPSPARWLDSLAAGTVGAARVAPTPPTQDATEKDKDGQPVAQTSRSSSRHGRTSDSLLVLGAPERQFDGEFTSIAAVRELPDGRILLLDRAANDLHLVDLEQGRATLVGRRGRGPGEYVQPGGLYAARDNGTYVTDRALRRLLIVSAKGQIRDTRGFAIPGIARGINVSRADDFVLDAEGAAYSTRLVFAADTPSDTEGIVRDSLPLVRFTPASERFDTLAWIAGPERVVSRIGPGVIASRITALSRQDAFAVAPDGRVAIIRSQPYRVEWVERDGRTARGPDYPVPQIRVTDEDRAALAAARAAAAAPSPLAGIRVGGQPIGALASGETGPRFAREKPAFADPDDVALSPEQEVWVARQLPFGATFALYDVFDRTGLRVRQVQLPPRARVVGFGPAALYVAMYDADDVPRLARWPR